MLISNKNVKSIAHLIYIMTMLMESSLAQTSGPTVTSAVSIVPGSTSLISIPKATSINLTSDFISGLIPSATPTSSQQQTTDIIFITAGSSSVSSTGLPVPTVNSDNNSNSSKLSSTDLGAIIGGCAGGLLLITIATVLCCVRRKKKRAKKEYDLGRSISASIIFNKDAYKQQQPVIQRGVTPNSTNPKPSYTYNNNTTNNDPTIKRYNVSPTNTTQEDGLRQVITPPVILYLNIHNQDNMMMEENPQRRKLSRGASEISKGARLSKYNFLSQAFSQMRTSYAEGALQQGAVDGGDNNNNEYHIENQQQVAAPEPSYANKKSGDRSYHDSMILSPYEFSDEKQQQQPQKKYQMYSMYEQDSTSEALSPIPSQSASTFFDPHRESTMTVGTLHAPLFHNNNIPPPTPPIINKHLYTSGVVTPSMDRDSVVSDVSQYSIFPPNRTNQTPTMMMMKNSNNSNNKPYPFF